MLPVLGTRSDDPLQILVRSQVRATQLVQCADSELGRAPQGRARGGSSVAVGEQVVDRDPAAMVRRPG